jgi:hypothetical protein
VAEEGERHIIPVSSHALIQGLEVEALDLTTSIHGEDVAGMAAMEVSDTTTSTRVPMERVMEDGTLEADTAVAGGALHGQTLAGSRTTSRPWHRFPAWGGGQPLHQQNVHGSTSGHQTTSNLPANQEGEEATGAAQSSAPNQPNTGAASQATSCTKTAAAATEALNSPTALPGSSNAAFASDVLESS